MESELFDCNLYCNSTCLSTFNDKIPPSHTFQDCHATPPHLSTVLLQETLRDHPKVTAANEILLKIYITVSSTWCKHQHRHALGCRHHSCFWDPRRTRCEAGDISPGKMGRPSWWTRVHWSTTRPRLASRTTESTSLWCTRSLGRWCGSSGLWWWCSGVFCCQNDSPSGCCRLYFAYIWIREQ